MTERAAIIQDRRKRLELRNGYRLLFFRVLILGLTLFVMFGQVFLLFRAEGMDMSPAVRDGDVLLAFRLYGDYRKNDLVIYRTEGRRRVGRIAARAGDTLDVAEDGVLLVNGVAQANERNEVMAAGDADYPLVVQEDSYYIVEDNRRLSRDSRDFGTVSAEHIEGKIITLLRRRGF